MSAMRISLEKAAELLLSDRVVAIPTETVYGLGALVSSPSAIKEIFRLKKRPVDNPLIVHIATMDQLKDLAKEISEESLLVAGHFWPGPLTIIFPADCKKVPEMARAGLPSVAIRMPNHPLTYQLIQITGPLVAPSANLSGRPSSTCREHVEEDFSLEFPVLDGGPCTQGVESTILHQREDHFEIARLGAITQEELSDFLGYSLPIKDQETPSFPPICPGQHYRHYAPQAKLILGKGPYLGEPKVVLGFQGRDYHLAEKVFLLGDLNQPKEILHNLYTILRKLDQEKVTSIWVDFDFSKQGPLRTLSERILRASSS